MSRPAILTPQSSAEIFDKGETVRFDPSVLPRLDPRLFDPRWLDAAGHLTGVSEGRNTAYFLRIEGFDLVLRHYWRGGLIGKVMGDRFGRVPARQSRAMREWDLLAWMRAHHLPVPQPIAARYSPSGLFYRADLVTRRIPNSRTLAEVVHEGQTGVDIWRGVGHEIGRMHALGVDHTDLNCRNILIDTIGAVWLIDFDKGRRTLPWAAAPRNLDRLYRSLEKERNRNPDLSFTPQDWHDLCLAHDAQRPDAGGKNLHPAPPQV
jgi:3-deoxy-D-manno-octulosonic acid kinase